MPVVIKQGIERLKYNLAIDLPYRPYLIVVESKAIDLLFQRMIGPIAASIGFEIAELFVRTHINLSVIAHVNRAYHSSGGKFVQRPGMPAELQQTFIIADVHHAPPVLHHVPVLRTRTVVGHGIVAHDGRERNRRSLKQASDAKGKNKKRYSDSHRIRI